MGRTSLDSTMTRTEHFARARRWGVAAAMSLAVLGAAVLASRSSGSPALRFLGVLAMLGVGVSVVSAAYRVLMGLSRAPDWRPVPGAPLAYFEPEEEELSLLKRVSQELGERLSGEIGVEHENIVDAQIEDERTWWRRFLESSEVVLPRYRFTFSIPTDTRPITLSVWIGRSKNDASYARIRLVLESECNASLSAPISWRDEITGEKSAASMLEADETLARALPGLIRRRILSGRHWIVHPDPSLVLEPIDGEARARVTLDTVEQDWKGGFVVKLGVGGFLSAVDRIESLLDDASRASECA